MSISTLLWQAKATTSGTYVDMPTPSSYKISWEDLDKKSSRSVVTGDLTRSVLGKKWYKISFSYKYLTPTQLETISTMINNPMFYVKAKSPMFGNTLTAPSGANGNWVELYGYVSKCDVEMLEAQIGYSLNFNFVQAKKGSWQ